MARLIDEYSEDDMDGDDWAQKYTHVTPEQSINPTMAAVHPESDVDERGYVIGWSTIASQKRFQVDHHCEACRVRLKERPDLLHIHHLDRDKRNNEGKNLQARCVICHSDADGHGHILKYVSPSDLAYVQELRKNLSKEP